MYGGYMVGALYAVYSHLQLYLVSQQSRIGPWDGVNLDFHAC